MRERDGLEGMWREEKAQQKREGSAGGNVPHGATRLRLERLDLLVPYRRLEGVLLRRLEVKRRLIRRVPPDAKRGGEERG